MQMRWTRLMKKRKSKGLDGVNDEEVVAHKTAESRKGARTGFCKFLRFLGGRKRIISRERRRQGPGGRKWRFLRY